MTRRRLRLAYLAPLYLIAAALVVNVFMATWGFRGSSDRYGFDAMVNFTAYRPFAYRVLMPLLIRGVDRATPFFTVTQERLERKRVYDRFGWTRGSEKQQVIALFLLLIFLVGAAGCARIASESAFPLAPPPLHDLLPVAAVLLLPLTFVRGGYMYDFPELFFFFACVGALLSGRWPIYYLLYGLAITNKETGILIVVYFLALYWRRMNAGRLVAHLGMHALIGVPLLAVIRFLAASHPGSGIEVRLAYNLSYLVSPGSYAGFFDIFLPFLPAPRGLNILSIAAVVFFTTYRWHAKPHPLKVLFVASAALIVPIYLVGGVADEIRALSLAFPGLYLLAFDTIQSFYRRDRAGTDVPAIQPADVG